MNAYYSRTEDITEILFGHHKDNTYQPETLVIPSMLIQYTYILSWIRTVMYV
jgi:hypothetical protein